MMTIISKSLPWDKIKTPNEDYHVRLAHEGMNIPIYWGKDTNGRLLFIIEFSADLSELFNKEKISVHGINIDLRTTDHNNAQNLILTLDQKIDSDLFYALCQTILSTIENITDERTAISLVLNHLKRWKQFLAGKRTRLLSEEEVRGLFAELCFLRTLYNCGINYSECTESWHGPDKAHQDFIFRDTAYEIKSLSGKERSAIRISSEDQLESICDNLILVVFRIFNKDQESGGISLNTLIQEINEEIANPDIQDIFERKLANYGYTPLNEYDTPTLHVSDVKYYSVRDDFPRLVKSSLQDGIARLSYDIELEKISKFETTPEIFKDK